MRSRGPPARRALAEAIPIASRRGTIQMVGRIPEKLFDFTIVSSIPVAFVCVSYCRQICTPVAEIWEIFQDKVLRLMMVAAHDAISRELWLRSCYGRWRFFRLSREGLVELGVDGHPLPGKAFAGT
jgi:hypothetical protein